MSYVLHPEGTRERDAQDLVFLDHLAERHGLRAVDCPQHHGGGCRRCNGHGVVYAGWTEKSCGAGCPVPERVALVRRARVN